MEPIKAQRADRDAEAVPKANDQVTSQPGGACYPDPKLMQSALPDAMEAAGVQKMQRKGSGAPEQPKCAPEPKGRMQSTDRPSCLHSGTDALKTLLGATTCLLVLPVACLMSMCQPANVDCPYMRLRVFSFPACLCLSDADHHDINNNCDWTCGADPRDLEPNYCHLLPITKY